MAAEIPRYDSRLSTAPSVGRVALPDVPGGSTIGAALAGLGTAVGGLGEAVRAGAEAANKARATTDYMQGLFDLQQKYRTDADWQTAPARFADERAALERDTIGRYRFGDATTAELETSFRRLGLSAQGQVDDAALGRLSDSTKADLDRQELFFFERLRGAKSGAERQAVIGEWDNALAGPAATGLISQEDVVARQQRRNGLIDEADLLATIAADPDAALKALDDPKNFPSLSPVERERYRAAARGDADALSAETLVNRARFNPALASLELGRVIDPRHMDAIFDQGLIGQESGGDPSAVSPKGALGIAQVLPGTAREVAGRLGLTDLAKLSDADLKAKLLADPDLNASLGRAYLQEMATRYEGSVPLALAAYNAGPGRADAWQKQAQALYGPSFTPLELLSVIDIKETRDYVAGIYARMGARLDPNLSPNARFAAGTRVGAILADDQREADQSVKDLAAVARSDDQTLEALKEGLPVAFDQLQAELMTQQAAARAGSTEAATRVRQLQEAWSNAPYVREAYRTPPAALAGAIAGLRDALDRTGTTTGPAYRRLKAFEAVQTEIDAQSKTDPIGLADRAGLIEAQPFDPNADFSDAATQYQLRVRDSEAAIAARTYGAPVVPFRPEEAAALKARFEQAAPEEKLTLLAGLGRGLGKDAFNAAVQTIAGADSGLAYAADIANQSGDGEALTRILQQYALEKSDGYKPPTLSRTDQQARVAETYGGALLALPTRQSALEGNAEKIFVQLAREKGVAPDAAAEWRLYDQALQMAAGRTADKAGNALGGIADVNGAETLVPLGFRADQVQPTLDALTDAMLKALPPIASGNGLPVTAQQIRNGTLVAVADGLYRVKVGERFAFGTDGGFWLLDIRKLQALASGSATPPRAPLAGKGGFVPP